MEDMGVSSATSRGGKTFCLRLEMAWAEKVVCPKAEGGRDGQKIMGTAAVLFGPQESPQDGRARYHQGGMWEGEKREVFLSWFFLWEMETKKVGMRLCHVPYVRGEQEKKSRAKIQHLCPPKKGTGAEKKM